MKHCRSSMKQQSVNLKQDKDLKNAGELYEWLNVTRAD